MVRPKPTTPTLLPVTTAFVKKRKAKRIALTPEIIMPRFRKVMGVVQKYCCSPGVTGNQDAI
jgi:hypothetical protein